MYRDAQSIDLTVKIDGEGREKVEKELGQNILNAQMTRKLFFITINSSTLTYIKECTVKWPREALGRDNEKQTK